MTKSQTMGARIGLAIFGAGMVFAASPGQAQTASSFQESPAAALSRHLTSLAANPRSLSPLMGAGRAALELGDAQAALTFFGRAEELAPQDGRIKMWIGSALVHLQQADGAQTFFAQAASLGVPEAEIACERGLAYDISGDPVRAQRDYRLALQAKRDPETARRLALSLAIAGDRVQALRVIDDQLRAQDRDAERTRILILALTGDSGGAARAVQASMPGGRGSAMAPFLERLSGLNAAERAAAVHLGIFPRSGRSAGPLPNVYASADPVQAGATDPRQAGLGRVLSPVRQGNVQTAGSIAVSAPKGAAPAVANPPAQRQVRSPFVIAGRLPEPRVQAAKAPPQAATGTIAPAVRSTVAGPVLPPPPSSSSSATAPAGQPQAAATPSSSVPAAGPIQLAGVATSVAAPIPAPAAASSLPPASSAPPQAGPTASATLQSPSAGGAGLPTPGFSVVQPIATAALAPSTVAGQSATDPAAPIANTIATAPDPAPAPVADARSSRLADVAALVASLPETTLADPPPAPKAPAAKASPKPAVKEVKTASVTKPGDAKSAVKGAAAKKPAAAVKKEPVEPARVWVQVAGGANKATLPKEYVRLKAKAPKLLAARGAWTAPLKATNRLLVGPFKTEKEAQEFVNELAKSKLSAFAWTSEAGQKIEKLPAK
jgi:hypothetical protein